MISSLVHRKYYLYVGRKQDEMEFYFKRKGSKKISLVNIDNKHLAIKNIYISRVMFSHTGKRKIFILCRVIYINVKYKTWIVFD